ncbi:MAG: efflux RND transporter periplasmic adaptor subunit [Phycisphaerae bacterium]|nr:efflux RND transporter periplasmic adaptor subunit [Phycisphaerae bacterium]
MKLIMRLLVLAALGAGAWAVWRSFDRPDELELRVTTTSIGPLALTVSATGRLAPTTEVLVGCEISGTVDEIFVEHNDRVTEGQVIARLKPELTRAEHEQAKADLAVAQARLKQLEVQASEAQRQFERVQGLLESGAASDEEFKVRRSVYEAAQADTQAGQAAVEGARSRVEHTQYRLDRSAITSPINGIVLDRRVDVGQTVAAALMAPELFVLAEDLSRMELLTDVSEADVGYICPGQAATFVVNAYRDRRFSGTVRQIRNQPKTVGNVVTYTVTIDVHNEDQLLRPGMPADVTIEVVRRDEILNVANAALRFRPPLPPAEILDLIEGLTWPDPPEQLHVTVAREVQTRPNEVSFEPPPIPPGKGTLWRQKAGRWEPVAVWTLFTDNRATAIHGGPVLGAGVDFVTEARNTRGRKSSLQEAIMLARPENRSM